MDKISVIVPVYNAEKYLKQCLDSLVSQTYKNIEIVCVDDGSSDGSLAILQEYSEKDERIKVISIENSGVSNARNVAIKNATGEYFAFCDSDDWFDKDYCHILHDVAVSENADIVMCSYVSETGDRSFERPIFEESKIVFDEQQIKNNLHRRLFGLINEELASPEKGDSIASLWTKLIKRDIVQKAEFCDLKEIAVFEDGLFLIDVLADCKKFVYINKPLYHYRKTNEQSITTKYKANLYNGLQNLYDKMQSRIAQNGYGEDYVMALNNRICLSMIGIGLNELENKNNKFSNRLKNLNDILETDRYKKAFDSLNFKWFSLKWKVFFGACKKRKTFILWCLLKAIKFLKRRIAK